MKSLIKIEEFHVGENTIDVLYFKEEWKESKDFSVVRSKFEYWLDFMEKLEREDKDGNVFVMPIVYYWDDEAQVRRDLIEYMTPRIDDVNPLQGIFKGLMQVADQYSKTA